MIFREVPFQYEMTTADGRRMGEGRSVGVHLSEVIKYMRSNYAGEKLDQAGGENYMMLGFALELIVEEALTRYFAKNRGTVVSQQETFLEGIYLTPDGYELEGGYYEEYKVTWKSSKKLGRYLETPEQRWNEFFKYFWHWMVQIKAHCYAVGTRKARLVAFFVMGDYSYKPPGGGPQFVCFEFEFTDEELEENWEMVKRVRDEMLETRGEAAA